MMSNTPKQEMIKTGIGKKLFIIVSFNSSGAQKFRTRRSKTSSFINIIRARV